MWGLRVEKNKPGLPLQRQAGFGVYSETLWTRLHLIACLWAEMMVVQTNSNGEFHGFKGRATCLKQSSIR